MRAVVTKQLRKIIKQKYRPNDGDLYEDLSGPLKRQYIMTGGRKAILDENGNVLAPEITGTISMVKDCERATYQLFKRNYSTIRRTKVRHVPR